MGVTTGVSTTLGSTLSATGTHFIIKAIGGVTSPTFTIQKNLSAFLNAVDKTDTAFNPLSGSIIIERPAPGQVIFDNGLDTNTFTMPDGIHFVKYYVTGAGSKGGSTPGGAGSTVIGHLSAPPGTTFKVKAAAAATIDDSPPPIGGNADFSAIYTEDGGTTLVRADGGVYDGRRKKTWGNYQVPNGASGGIALTTNAYVLNGYVVKGGSGMLDTDDGGDEESVGASSWWGNAPAPGGGQGGHSRDAMGPPPGGGIVMFEWS